jgi:hypothetical protein
MNEMNIEEDRRRFRTETVNMQNKINAMIQRTKQIENILRNELAMPMLIETMIELTFQAVEKAIRDPYSPPPKKRTKYE